MPLGRGLSSLIPPRASAYTLKAQAREEEKIFVVPLERIRTNPQQPRREMGDLDELTASIRRYGVLQPVVLTKKDDFYELVAGERRVKAAEAAGLKTIPAVVRTASELEKLELALIENIQRQDLNPLERAEGYAKLIEEFGLTQEEASERVGVSRPTFANTLRLLNLPEEIKFALATGKISESHAKTILGLKSKEEQLKYFQRLLGGKKISVRELEEKVYGRKSSQVVAWEEELQGVFGTKVEIKERRGKGTINFGFFSWEDLTTLIRRFLTFK